LIPEFLSFWQLFSSDWTFLLLPLFLNEISRNFKGERKDKSSEGFSWKTTQELCVVHDKRRLWMCSEPVMQGTKKRVERKYLHKKVFSWEEFDDDEETERRTILVVCIHCILLCICNT
jgi:hypothetical protein